MISYRALKKLIGETSLERKCRFLFGLALLVLITTSFYVYARRTRALVESQQILAARGLVFRLIQLRHYQLFIRGQGTASSGNGPTDTPTRDQKLPSDPQNLIGDNPPPQQQTTSVSENDEVTNATEADVDAGLDPGTGDPGTGDPGTGDPGARDLAVADSGASAPGASDPGTGTDRPGARGGLTNDAQRLPGAAAAILPQSDAAIQQLRQFEAALNQIPESSTGPIWRLINVATEFPDTAVGDEALSRFRNAEPQEDEYFTIRPNETTGSRELLYYYAIRPETSCLPCHAGQVAQLKQLESESRRASGLQTGMDSPSASGSFLLNDDAPVNADGKDRPPLMAMARIVAPLDSMEAQLSRNRAVLLASGIVTSFLAMMAAYAIVRYIIVKPVLHLKDVSDEIARGNLNLRAEISTGDEFEELGHAFNRMLRHMMTVNDELRGLNLTLDGKVDQLAHANMELFNNNKLKDDFLATMSHELRTPLNSILGFSDILQNAANLDERQRRYVHNIQTSGQSLMVQINDLLDLAKIESGKMELHLDRVDLPGIIEQQVQQMMPLADRKNIDLRIDAPSTPLPRLLQDRGKISQILNNLLSNAIKFTPEGGRVRVVFRQMPDQMIEFSVEDTGIGIPLDEQEHIFEKFRQGSTVPGGRDHVKREYEGTGLGLSIVRELSRLLGGDVALQSEFGKGSLFIVRLPVTAEIRRKDPILLLESRSASGLGRITSVDLMNPRTGAVPDDAHQNSDTTPVDLHSGPVDASLVPRAESDGG